MNTKTKTEALNACDELDRIFDELIANRPRMSVRYKLAAHKRYYTTLAEIHQALGRTNPPQDD